MPSSAIQALHCDNYASSLSLHAKVSGIKQALGILNEKEAAMEKEILNCARNNLPLTCAQKRFVLTNRSWPMSDVLYYTVYSNNKSKWLLCRGICSDRKISKLLERFNKITFYHKPDQCADVEPCCRCKPYEPNFSPPDKSAWLAAVHLWDHRYDKCTLKELSRRVGLAECHLHRTFKRVIGRGPKDFLAFARDYDRLSKIPLSPPLTPPLSLLSDTMSCEQLPLAALDSGDSASTTEVSEIGFSDSSGEPNINFGEKCSVIESDCVCKDDPFQQQDFASSLEFLDTNISNWCFSSSPTLSSPSCELAVSDAVFVQDEDDFFSAHNSTAASMSAPQDHWTTLSSPSSLLSFQQAHHHHHNNNIENPNGSIDTKLLDLDAAASPSMQHDAFLPNEWAVRSSSDEESGRPELSEPGADISEYLSDSFKSRL